MKTILSVSVVALFLLSPLQTLSQEKGDIRANAGVLGIGYDEALGFSLGAEYFLTNRLSAAPYLLYAENNRISPMRESILGVDLRYYFIKKRVNVYVGSGYGSYQIKRELPGSDNINRLNSVGAGAGAEYGLSNRLSINFDARMWHNSDGLLRVLSFGVAYRLNKRE